MSKHVRSSHEIRIPLPIGQAFMLFTPAGEELWVDGWNPTYIHPHDGATTRGMVFTTGAGPDHTIWYMADFDRASYFSRYVRTTPGIRTGAVEVQCRPEGDDATVVRVSYDLVALSEEGERSLQAFEGDAYAAMIESWRSAIEARMEELAGADIR